MLMGLDRQTLEVDLGLYYYQLVALLRGSFVQYKVETAACMSCGDKIRPEKAPIMERLTITMKTSSVSANWLAR